MRTATRLSVVLVPVLATAALAGCDTLCNRAACGPCAPALTLRIARADGAALSGLEVEGVRVACAEPDDEGVIVCSAASLPVGTYLIVVRAEGEAPAELEVAIRPDSGCCSCGTVPVTRDVVLGEMPVEDDAGASKEKEDASV
jgi:hypothetical protein